MAAVRLRGEERVVLARRGPTHRDGVGLRGAAIILDLTVGENLILTETPRTRFARGSPIWDLNLDVRTHARDLPLATLRIVDLARALAIEPDVLLLDEMTAALPADLTAASST